MRQYKTPLGILEAKETNPFIYNYSMILIYFFVTKKFKVECLKQLYKTVFLYKKLNTAIYIKNK